jgi:CubicO group peptidase (beta-lactamase class C family)
MIGKLMSLPSQLNPARLQVALDRVGESVQKGEIPCAVFGVANSHETICCEVFTRSGGDQVSQDSIFLLASITKPMVATAVMQLVERGLLNLAAPITRYIPEFAQPGKLPVTTWNLLTHTSGMEENAWMMALHVAKAPQSAYLMAACQSNLHFVPGTRYEYCSLSFFVLAELITRLSGLPYPEYLQKHVFAPLSMVDTSFDPGSTKQDREAPVHNLMTDVETFKKGQHPGGGLWSTWADVVAFGQAYLKAGKPNSKPDTFRVLSPATIELMTRDHISGLSQMIEGRPQPAHYGLGWGKYSVSNMIPGSVRAFEHGGATGTMLWVDPDYDLVYLLLTNHWAVEWHIQHTALQAVYAAYEY